MDPKHAKHLPVLQADPAAVAERAVAGPESAPLAQVIPITREQLRIAEGRCAQCGRSRGEDGTARYCRACASRDQSRSRRKREIRAQTVSIKRLPKSELERLRMLYPPEEGDELPATRAECRDGPRPCPFVSCAYHLYLDISAKTGAIKLNFPDLEVHELAESCALDVADRGGETLENVGALLNITRERVRQVEEKALAKLKALRSKSALRDYEPEGHEVTRGISIRAEDLDEEGLPEPAGPVPGGAGFGGSIADEYDLETAGVVAGLVNG